MVFLFFAFIPKFNAFVGHDNCTDEAYERAGVTHKSYVFRFDKYYFDGENISQFTAETLVDLYDNIFRGKCKDDKNAKELYRTTAKFIIKLIIKQGTDASYWKAKYYTLLLRC